ncbi:MAG: hypothetical protein AB4426_35470 [Xenococcaceae cyanobacterium]
MNKYAVFLTFACIFASSLTSSETLGLTAVKVQATGTIDGDLSALSEFLPAFKVCAQSTTNFYLLHCTKIQANQWTYSLTVSPGEYFIFAQGFPGVIAGRNLLRRPTFYYGDDTQNENQPKAVRVSSGETLTNINPNHLGEDCNPPTIIVNDSVINDPSWSPKKYCVLVDFEMKQ